MSKQKQSKRLHDENINPYMSDTDPRNPFGPNYIDLPYSTKL